MILDGNKIVRLRKEQGLIQKQLADLAGTDDRTIQNAEAGRPVKIVTGRGIADALGVRPKDLMVPEVGEVEAVSADEEGNGNAVRPPNKTTHKNLQSKDQARMAMADDGRAKTLGKKAKADADHMWNAGLHDGLNCDVDSIDYRLLREVEERTRADREAADPENVIATFDQINRNATSPFPLNYPGEWEYKRGFIEGLLTLADIGGGKSVAPPKNVSPAPKPLFERGSS